jgi:5-methyltetrahydrofolate--homocysteine methyltransferase
MQDSIQSVYSAVVNGQNQLVTVGVSAALEAGARPVDILNEGMIGGMAEVGRQYELGEMFVPDMLVAARAMQAGLAVLKPHLLDENVESKGKVVLGTVKGDLHDIGKNLVSMMLQGAGFEIVDMGTDVAADRFAATVKSERPALIALSALLTNTMPQMKRVIDELQAAGVRDQVKVMVGGAPVSEAFAVEIGADGYAPDASRAVAVAKSLVGKE